jgi:endonuclease-3
MPPPWPLGGAGRRRYYSSSFSRGRTAIASRYFLRGITPAGAGSKILFWGGCTVTSGPTERRRIAAIRRKLAELYPDATCALVHENPLQLLVATILSAQCTDVRVNLVTPALFARFPDARAFADSEPADLEEAIRSTGFFRNKARNIRACCQAIVTEHGGAVPGTLEKLVALPGIGRKTANVILGNAFSVPGITVDTHVGRLSRRLGLSAHTDPAKVERDLMALIPRKEWTDFSHRVILHGRQVCFARKPNCQGCTLQRLCPKIGVKQP